jgi:hypothetical protein
MAQSWHHLLFAHWPVPQGQIDRLRGLLPPSLALDLFAKEAWLGVIPFTMTGVRPRWVPPIPFFSAFHELNVRTYVVKEGKPGIFFFSLDASNRLAVALARWSYHLPYFNSRMSLELEGKRVNYASFRQDHRSPPAELKASYGPVGGSLPAPEGSLDAWLTARYCLYAADKRRRVYRGEIDHPPWPLEPAEAEIEKNTMTAPLGLSLPDTKPLLHFSRRMDVKVWPLERVFVS